MSFLSNFSDALEADRVRNLLQALYGSYHQQFPPKLAEAPVLAMFVMMLSIFVTLLITLCVYKFNVAKDREEQPRGCRKLGLTTESNLSNEFNENFAQGRLVGTGEVSTDPWRVKSLWIYPVKSCRGVEIDHADIVTTGMKYDRQFTFAQLKSPASIDDMLDKKQTGRTWEFITQRKFPRLATVKVEMWVPDHSSETYSPTSDDVEGGGVVVVRFPHQQSGWRGKLGRLKAIFKGSVPEKQFRVPFDPTPSQVQKAGYKYEKAIIWKDTVNALNFELQVPEELRCYLGVRNKLSILRIDNSALREVHRCAPKAEDLGYQPVIGLQDAYPLHLMNLASVRDLEIQIPKRNGVSRLSARRFRPNIISENHLNPFSHPQTN